MTLSIGLTGGIGSGKSTVAKIFSDLGVPVFDTDVIAKELVNPGEAAVNEIRQIFGKNLINENGELDREMMKQNVFNSEESREQLESILHPKIRERLLSDINSCTAPYCIAVIPLLVEKNWQNIVDRVLVVDVPEDEQLARATSRDNATETLVKQIMLAQANRHERLAHANDIIDNSGTREALASQVNKLHENYLALSKSLPR